MPGVLVIGETAGGHLLPASLEVATAGAALAQALGEPLRGALIGDKLDGAASNFTAAFTTLYLAEHATLQRYTAHAWVPAARAVILACNPCVVLCPQTLRAREWMPALADAGWVKSTHQVGLSGSSLNADLYIAVGISGAVQHLAGINSSAVVAAINTDTQADIFTRAHYGVVGDYKDVLPGFIERVRRLRGAS